jgi:hypothetical protein
MKSINFAAVATVFVAILAAVSDARNAPVDRNKSGTTGGRQRYSVSQVTELDVITAARSFAAEREGNETSEVVSCHCTGSYGLTLARA